jgi:hypothetical protein
LTKVKISSANYIFSVKEFLPNIWEKQKGVPVIFTPIQHYCSVLDQCKNEEHKHTTDTHDKHPVDILIRIMLNPSIQKGEIDIIHV